MQWPPLSSEDYRFLRLFKIRSERAWDDDAAVRDGLSCVIPGEVQPGLRASDV